MGRLDGRTAIITGAAAGVGLECARLLSEEGAQVVLLDIRGPALADAAESLSAAPVAAMEVDVRDYDAVREAVADAAARFGRVDTLVNSAAVLHYGRLDSPDPAAFDRVMRTNVLGVWNTMAAVLPGMRDGGGAIVNIASINGISVFPEAGLYSASKSALIMMSRVFAMENADAGVRVNLVLPGSIEGTEFVASALPEGADVDRFFEILSRTHPLGRNARTSDVAKAVLFLASDASEFITGTLLNVDGGRHMATNRPTSAVPQ